MITITKHFEERVNKRFVSNRKDKLDFVINTFKDIYKKIQKKKINPKIQKTISKNNEVYILYYSDFKYYFKKDNGDITLITFGIRDNFLDNSLLIS